MLWLGGPLQLAESSLHGQDLPAHGVSQLNHIKLHGAGMSVIRPFQALLGQADGKWWAPDGDKRRRQRLKS